jgi:hypothetical protein
MIVFGLVLGAYWTWIKWLNDHNSSILPWSKKPRMQNLFDDDHTTQSDSSDAQNKSDN